MNPFDQALNGYGPDGLEGLGSKLKKAAKKVVKQVTKAVKDVPKLVKKVVKNPIRELEKGAKSSVSTFVKAHRTTIKATRKTFLPAKVDKVVTKIEKSPITKAVALTAAGLVAGPAIGALFGAAGGALTAGQVASALSTSAVGAALKENQADKAAKIEAAMASQAQAQANAEIEAELRTIVNDPAFVEMAMRMLQSGEPIEKIVQTWVDSEAYKNAAIMSATNAVYPAAYHEMIKAVIPEAQAKQWAMGAAGNVAIKATEQVRSENKSLAGVALLAIPLIMAAMG